MSKLSEMIATLCPNGVEYKKLGEIGDFYSGLSGKSKDDFKEGNAKFITYMNVYSNPSLKIDVDDRVKIGKGEKQNIVEYGDVLFTGSSETPDECGMTAVLTQRTDEPLYLNSFCFGFRLRDKTLFEPDFLKHLFRSAELRRQIKRTANGVTRFNVSKSKMANVVIPLPPLPIQREIVQTLDNFANLTAELTAELAKRKKQYEHYRDMLLNFTGGGRYDKFGNENGSPHIEWKRLGEVALVTKLAGFEFTNFVKYSDKGRVIALRGLNVKNGHLVLDDVKYIDGSDLSKLSRSKLFLDDMLFTYVGTVGQVALIDKNDRYYLAPNVALIRFEQKIVYPAFMKFYFQTNYFMKSQIDRFAGESSMKNLTMEKIRMFQIPLPSLAEQKRIVDILDRFDSLCNSLTEGLPAEIALRKKQYEYYRDKLLSFKEAS